jgi:hypothetical protein
LQELLISNPWYKISLSAISAFYDSHLEEEWTKPIVKIVLKLLTS